MPYDKESLPELNRRLETELPRANASPALRRNLFTPFARALAAAVHGIHEHIDWRTRQMFPQTCDDDVLENLHVGLWLQGSKRRAAAPAVGRVVVRGAGGIEIPQGTLFNRNDSVQFAVVEGVITDSSGSTTLRVCATQPGAAGNTDNGAMLRFANPIAGIENTATVTYLSGGSDIESLPELRRRVIESRNLGGQVGKLADWIRWAKEVPGITRVWPAPKLSGLGTVTMYVVRDHDSNIFPDAAELSEVQKHLEHSALPNGEIHVVSPLPKPVNFKIKITPDTPEVRAAVKAELSRVLDANASPVAYDAAGDLELPARGHTIPRSHLTQAISNAAGEYDHQLLLPAGDITPAVGELVSLGQIEWAT